jgi:hypothetical protein
LVPVTEHVTLPPPTVPELLLDDELEELLLDDELELLELLDDELELPLPVT